jgi:dihydrofolate synthase/folylpolyglutamate synthase
VKVAVQSVREYFPEQEVNILSGVMTDKDFDEMIEELKGVTYQAFTVTPDNPRALPAADYAAVFERLGVPASAHGTVAEAVHAAMEKARQTGAPVVSLGSLYMYGEVRAAVEKE